MNPIITYIVAAAISFGTGWVVNGWRLNAAHTNEKLELAKKAAEQLDERIKEVRESEEKVKDNLGEIATTLQKNLSKISKNKPVITCCASGMRSASAKGILQNNGFEVYNGGGWSTLKAKI